MKHWQLVLAHAIGAVALAVPRPAVAQSPGASVEPHRQLLSLALDTYSKARCGNQLCAPATAAERANPPITDEQARAIVTAGIISVLAEHCELDWEKRNFFPLMRHHRETLKMTERQMALVGLLHGVTMGAYEETVRKNTCTPEAKVATEKRLLAR
jgi:hypothetical protein